MKTAVFSAKGFEIEYFNKLNKTHELIYIDKALNIDTVHLAAHCKAISVFTNDTVNEQVLNELHHLGVNFVATRSAGFDHIDLKVAKSLGIKVGYVPEYSPYAIAEHAIAMIMALNRKIVEADKNVKNYNFKLDTLIGFDLNGKTVGIVGLGKIGGIVAKILHGFGCKLLGFDPNPNQEFTEKYALEYVSINDIFSQSDIITLHTPFNEHTKYLVNKDTLALIKPTAMLINTARGGVVNTADLIEVLKAGKIGAVGLDVYEKEKGLFFYDHQKDIPQDDTFARLLSFKNVLVTGHQAFLTSNALTNIMEKTLEHLSKWELGYDVKEKLA